MPLIGTAGHVDHGKSTLIKRLTGRDPDRWDEEKRRGLTIDLGFSWTTFEDGSEVSFVDVPGHERYLKNMLAGIEAIDVALFVVAADEGWMPQSEEHLAVLDLLDVRSGVIALTKTDLVDDDLVELATLEIAEKLEGTALHSAPIVPVSAESGAGLEDLVAVLGELLTTVDTPDLGRPRLWVDRSFSVTGAGTVVTGTLLDGALRTDETVTVYPDGQSTRVRGIQSHETEHELVEPGRRVALNLGSIAHTDVDRGDMIGRPGEWDTSGRIAVSLRPARYVDELDRRGAYQIHMGSAVERAEIVGLEDMTAVLKLARRLPMAVGDRFIMRDTGRKLVVAGGRVLDPSPGRTSAALRISATIDPDSGANEIASRLLDIRGMASASDLERQTAGGVPAGRQIGDWVVSLSEAERLTGRARNFVSTAHEENPLRPGIPIATLAGLLDVSQEIVETLIDESNDLVRIGPDVSVGGREIEIPPEAEADWERAREALGRGLAVPTVGELAVDPELLHLKVRLGELVRVSQDLVYLAVQIDQLLEILRSLPEGFTVAEFRDAAGLSRKYAVPVLEWADREGVTVRRGDRRWVRRAKAGTWGSQPPG